MRTLQEKYNGIQEGKFSKEHFLADARMELPNLVTRFNGYDDAVQILKNRGMIQEAKKETVKEWSPYGSMAFSGNDKPKQREPKEGEVQLSTLNKGDVFKTANGSPLEFRVWGHNPTGGVDVQYTDYEFPRPNYTMRDDVMVIKLDGEVSENKSYKTSSNSKEAQHLKKGDIIGSGDEVVSVSAGAKTPAGKVEVTLKTKSGSTKTSTWGKTTKVGVKPVTEAKQPKATKKGLTDYRYKPTNEMDKYPYEQILRGIRVELETLGVQGTPTAEQYAKALAKVSKNLAKDSIFYTNQVAGVNPKVDLHDKMITATAKNTVDTFNGMKKAELKEGFKKLIKKVLSEEVMDVESYIEEEVYEMYGEDSVDESAMGDIYLLAQEHDRFEHFVQAVEDEFGPVEDIAELEHIFNSTRGEDDIDYGDENFSDGEDTEYESPSDRMYNSDAWVQAQQDMMETRKAKSLSELLK